MAGSARVAFVTTTTFPNSPPDDRLALDVLNARGIRAEPAIWGAEGTDWSAFDLVVLRSTWDYHRRPTEFFRWLEATAAQTSMWNPLPLVRWNSHKRYLVELAAGGASVVPTEVVVQGSHRHLEEITSDHGWSDVAVKPAVGADAYELRLFPAAEISSAEEHLRRLLRTGDALVQPILEAARDRGERSLIYLDGEFSHAAEYDFVLGKEPRAGRPVPVEPALRESAEKVLSLLPTVPLYARLDYLPSANGEWLLGELEVIEPDLFLRTDPSAPGRFSDAIARKL